VRSAGATPFAYWSLLVNWRCAGAACQTSLDDGDEVLWAYDTAQRPLVLRLSAPAHVAVGAPFAVNVRDGWIRADGLDGAVGAAQRRQPARAATRRKTSTRLFSVSATSRSPWQSTAIPRGPLSSPSLGPGAPHCARRRP
jgi:hypothetical protein